ncbi:hypothetical protein HII12_004771 [Brettanomyces bruxellensis]|uniref:Alpha-1,6-mannosyltransferase n=1 Tax=Dekkera bruxellensis TaxID=5007 RepID=A0A8H6EQY6_DEKBR|nr:hypothetical protein HII12_004771 [Brettanomyces bruxellensis]
MVGMQNWKIYDAERCRALFRFRPWKTSFQRYRKQLLLAVIILYIVIHLAVQGSSGTLSFLSEFEFGGNEDDFKTLSLRLRTKNKIDDKKASLREKLAFYFPYEPEKPVPRTVWQTWKCGAKDKKFPKRFREPHRSWKEGNPKSDVIIVADDQVKQFIDKSFGKIPEVATAFDILPSNILKADFFRYLVIFARGGTYTDLDTYCLQSIDKWAPFDAKYRTGASGEVLRVKKRGVRVSKRQEERGVISERQEKQDVATGPLDTPVGMTIGIEADPDRPDWADWYARRIQFCQWTFQAKKGHPLLREVIIRVVEETFRKKRMNRLKYVEGRDNGDNVMQWTGPGIFTDTVFDYLNNVVSRGKAGDGFGVGSQYWVKHKKYDIKKRETDVDTELPDSSNRQVNREKFENMQEPVLVDDVMVLPITSFSPGVNQMGAKDTSDPMAYVQHLFGGTWKPQSERMQ